jgi:hypothetical protein
MFGVHPVYHDRADAPSPEQFQPAVQRPFWDDDTMGAPAEIPIDLMEPTYVGRLHAFTGVFTQRLFDLHNTNVLLNGPYTAPEQTVTQLSIVDPLMIAEIDAAEESVFENLLSDEQLGVTFDALDFVFSPTRLGAERVSIVDGVDSARIAEVFSTDEERDVFFSVTDYATALTDVFLQGEVARSTNRVRFTSRARQQVTQETFNELQKRFLGHQNQLSLVPTEIQPKEPAAFLSEEDQRTLESHTYDLVELAGGNVPESRLFSAWDDELAPSERLLFRYAAQRVFHVLGDQELVVYVDGVDTNVKRGLAGFDRHLLDTVHDTVSVIAEAFVEDDPRRTNEEGHLKDRYDQATQLVFNTLQQVVRGGAFRG